jgi:ribonuclease P protein component
MRLLNSKSFQYIFNQPNIQSTLEMSVFGRMNFLEHPRLGLIIPRKNVRYAHNRNLIKRLIRETFRMLQYKLISMDFIVTVRKHTLRLSNKKIITILQNLWLHYYR